MHDDVTLVPCAAGRFLMGGDHARIELEVPTSPLNNAMSGRSRIRRS